MSAQDFRNDFLLDEKGNPSGGSTQNDFLKIKWQNGPLAVDGNRIEPNGCFVETVIAIAKSRLEFYQDSKFNCVYNQRAIGYLNMALEQLAARTQERESRGVEGTHAT